MNDTRTAGDFTDLVSCDEMKEAPLETVERHNVGWDRRENWDRKEKGNEGKKSQKLLCYMTLFFGGKHEYP